MKNPLIKCIKYLYPKSKYFMDFEVSLDADGNSNIIAWNEATLGPQPALSEILAVLPEAETAHQLAICHARRRAEYPPMADYLDGIVKGDQAQVQKYIDDCLAVKAKYPKP